ncbi:hypothetical protein QUB63_12045 [Microcoleus sp. ARI1-B5]|uniref:hypothetical protein n=1 Tax=unclassified Microcoleus TaxID=2642155 RepID=UPI002FD37BDF
MRRLNEKCDRPSNRPNHQILPTQANHRTLSVWFRPSRRLSPKTATSISGVAFGAKSNWGLLDRAQMQEELEAILSKPVDLISKRAIDRSFNPIRRL